MALPGYGVISVDGSMLVGPYLPPAAMGDPMATSCLSFCLAHSQAEPGLYAWQTQKLSRTPVSVLYLFVDSEVHLGSILASKTAPRGTPTRKGRPSILNNPPMKIKLFDSVGVARDSRGRPLKRNTFHTAISTPKCLQNGSKMAPKQLQKNIKKRCRNCLRKV